MAESDLTELRKQCIKSLYRCTENVCKYFVIDTEKDAELAKLKSHVQAHCIQEAEQAVAIQALERAKRETDASNVDSLEARYKAYLSSMAGKQLNMDNHPFMKEFNNIIEKRLGKALDRSRQNLDASVAITETQERYIDPITQAPIVDPVKNNACGHIYEKEAILELLKMNKKTRCPVAGCKNKAPVREQDLVSDEELRFRMTLQTHSTMIEDTSITNLDSSLEQ